MSGEQGLQEGSAVVPGIDAPSSVACVRSLGRKGIDTVVVGTGDRTPAARSRYCTETTTAPSPHDDLDGYTEALLSLAARPDVRTILPVREEDVLVLAKHRKEFRRHVYTPWPSFDTLQRVHDRLLLDEVAEKAGVPAPETRELGNAIDWTEPWIVKSRYAVLAAPYLPEFDAHQCRPAETTVYPNSAPDHDALRARFGHRPVAQRYVPGDEFGFFAICDHGTPLATFQHRQRRGYSYTGGASAFRESIDDPALDEVGRAILDALDWHGVAMVEFLKDPASDTYQLMEVNPRFWSSLPFSVRAGADFPTYLWWLAIGASERVERGYRTGIAGHLLRGELLYLRSILRDDHAFVERPGLFESSLRVVRSLLAHPRFDYFERDDPLPFGQDLANAIWTYRRQRNGANTVSQPVEVPPPRAKTDHS